MDVAVNNQQRFSRRVNLISLLLLVVYTFLYNFCQYICPLKRAKLSFLGFAIASSVYNEIDNKEIMSRDPHANVGIIENLDRGCKLPLSQESHCEQDFGAHHAIDGIMNHHMDFFCSMFHAKGYPWLLGTKIEKFNIL